MALFLFLHFPLLGPPLCQLQRHWFYELVLLNYSEKVMVNYIITTMFSYRPRYGFKASSISKFRRFSNNFVLEWVEPFIDCQYVSILTIWFLLVSFSSTMSNGTLSQVARSEDSILSLIAPAIERNSDCVQGSEWMGTFTSDDSPKRRKRLKIFIAIHLASL